MISNPIYPSVNSTCLNQTDTIINELPYKKVTFVTSLQKGFYQLYYKFKNGLFLSYGFYGSLNTINNVGDASLVLSSGTASLTRGWVMSVSFLSSLTLKVSITYIPDGKVKSSLTTV